MIPHIQLCLLLTLCLITNVRCLNSDESENSSDDDLKQAFQLVHLLRSAYVKVQRENQALYAAISKMAASSTSTSTASTAPTLANSSPDSSTPFNLGVNLSSSLGTPGSPMEPHSTESSTTSTTIATIPAPAASVANQLGNAPWRRFMDEPSGSQKVKTTTQKFKRKHEPKKDPIVTSKKSAMGPEIERRSQEKSQKDPRVTSKTQSKNKKNSLENTQPEPIIDPVVTSGPPPEPQIDPVVILESKPEPQIDPVVTHKSQPKRHKSHEDPVLKLKFQPKKQQNQHKTQPKHQKVDKQKKKTHRHKNSRGKRKHKTHQQNHKSQAKIQAGTSMTHDKPITHGDPVVAQIASEIIKEMNEGCEKKFMTLKDKINQALSNNKKSENSIQMLRRKIEQAMKNKSEHSKQPQFKSSLKIHLEKSTRMSLPLSANNAFCFYVPDSPLCRIFRRK